MQNFNLSENQMDQLLRFAGKKMGADPQKLREQMESGQTDALLQGLSPEQRQKISGLMNDPQAIQQLVSNPKVQQLLRGLMGK